MNDEVTHSLKKSQQRLAHEFSNVLDDAQDLLQHAAGEAGKGYSEARHRLEDSVRSARKRISALEHAVLDGARHAGRSADSYVRHHPWETIAVGAAVGVLVGVLIARRR